MENRNERFRLSGHATRTPSLSHRVSLRSAGIEVAAGVPARLSGGMRRGATATGDGAAAAAISLHEFSFDERLDARGSAVHLRVLADPDGVLRHLRHEFL